MKTKINSVKLTYHLLNNFICLVVTFLCLGLVQLIISNSSSNTDWLFLCILASSIYICAAVSDILLAVDPDYSFFNYIAIFLMSISIVFIFISQLTLPTYIAPTKLLGILILFIIIKSIAYLFSSSWAFPKFLSTKVMIFGDYNHAATVHRLINDSRGRYELQNIININAKDTLNPETDENSDFEDNRLYLEAKKNDVKIIVASFPERRGKMPVQQLIKCRMLGIKIVEVPTFYEFISRKLYIENLKPSDLVFSSGFSLSIKRSFIKRAMDITLASIALLIFAPFFPLIALIIHLDSPGPIFFRQVRMGENDKLFHIIKFRTMRSDAEKTTGAVWASKEDPRITRIGNFLRKSRIDELPQLINILQGEMSLIGPRPERPEFISELKKSIPYYSERHHVKPGVTGWAQVRYPYGASVEDALEKLRYDLFYIKNQSIFLDFEILFRTFLIVFTRNGAR